MTVLLTWLLEPLQQDFMVRALLISILVSCVCGLLSCFMTLKGWALMGDAVSHAVMPGVEIAYAVTKGALHQMTRSIDHALSRSRIIANCINPGPVDTGYADGDVHAAVASRFPDGRWGTPTDIADVVGFLVSDEGAWIRGQVLDVEGGFRRFA